MEDTRKLLEEFLGKYSDLLDKLGGKGTDVPGSLRAMFSGDMEDVLKGKPVDLMHSLLSSWFGKPHAGVGRAFERNKATLRIIRKLRAEVLPKEIAAKAFQKGTSANSLTDSEKSYLQENLTGMLRDLGHLVESVVREHAVDTKNSGKVAAAEAELHELMSRLAEAQRQEAKHEKVLPDPDTAVLPDVQAAAIKKVLKDELPEASDSELSSFAEGIAHNYQSVLGALRKQTAQNGNSEGMTAEEIPHAARHMARRIMSVKGTEKYDASENLEDTISSYDKQVKKILDNAKKARTFFGRNGVMLRALDNFRMWLRKEYDRKQKGGIAAGLTDKDLREHLAPVEKVIMSGSLEGNPKGLEDEMNKVSAALGIPTHYVLPDHLWDIVEGKSYDNGAWLRDLRDLRLDEEFLWTIDPKEDLEKQWFMKTDEEMASHKEALSTVLASLEWVHTKLEGNRTFSGHLHTILVHALSSGSYIGKEGKILEELRELGMPTKARVPFADRTHTSAKGGSAEVDEKAKSGVLSYVESRLANAMHTLWVPKDKEVENVGGLATLVRNKAQEVRKLREEDLAVLPEGHAGSLLMPKGKLLTQAHKKRIAESVSNAMEKKTVRTNPYPEAVAKDYVKSVLANLEKRDSVSRGERQPDYAELLTYGEGFWEGLRNFITTFNKRFREYRSRMERVLSRNAHEAVNTEPAVKQSIAEYTKAVENYARSLSRGAALAVDATGGRELAGQAVVDQIRSKVASHIKGLLNPDAVLVAKNYIERDPVVQPLREALIHAIRNPEEAKGSGKADKAYTSLLANVKSYLERSQNGFDPVTADMLSRSGVHEMLKSLNMDYEPLYSRISSDPRRSGISDATKAEIQRISKALVARVYAEQPSEQDVAEARKNLEESSSYQKALADIAEAFRVAPSASTNVLTVVNHAASYSAAKDRIEKELGKSKEMDPEDIVDEAEKASGFKSDDHGIHIAVGGEQEGIESQNKELLESFVKNPLDSLFSAARTASAANGGWVLPYLLEASSAVNSLAKKNGDSTSQALARMAQDRYKHYASMGSFDEHLVSKAQNAVVNTDAFEKFNSSIGEASAGNDLEAVRRVAEGLVPAAGEAAKEFGISPKVTLLTMAKTLGAKDPIQGGSERALAKLNEAFSSLQTMMQQAQPAKRGSALIEETSPNNYDVTSALSDPLKSYRSLKLPVGAYQTLRSLRDAVRESKQYKDYLESLLDAHTRGLGNLNSALGSEFSRVSRNVANAVGVPRNVAAAVMASLLNTDLPQGDSDENAGTAKKLFLTDDHGSVGSLEPHNYPGIENGAFNAMRRYFNDLKKTHYFNDMLKGDSPVAGSLKMAAGRFRRGENDIEPGTKLHEVALQNLDNAYQEITGSSLYLMVTDLLSRDPNADVSDFFTNVQEWNDQHSDSPITVKSIDGFMKAMDRLLQVEKIYDEDASRVRSEFMSGVRGIYRNLGDIEKRRGRNV